MFSDKRQKTKMSPSPPPPPPDCNVWLALKPTQSSHQHACKKNKPLFEFNLGNANVATLIPPAHAHADFSFHDYFPHGVIFPGAFSNNYGSSGKALFTALQLQELERQKLIHNYIMSSVTVPPHLLSGFASGPGSRNSGGSDPEPWRCKRTDGKKWRCSRDVAAPDQKYCDRHAHKSKPRSRKHVEINHSNSNSHAIKSPTLTSSSYQHQPHSKPNPNPNPRPSCVEWQWRGQQQQEEGVTLDNSSTTSCSSSMIPGEEENGGSGGMTKMPLMWMNGNGGPLGEALLCLGNGRDTCGAWNPSSPRRHY